MNDKAILGLFLAVGVLGFAAGRWASPVKVVTETHTVEVEKKVTDTEAERNRHKETTTKTEERPDGTKETTTTTVEDTNTSKNSHSDTDIAKDSQAKAETLYNKPSLTVSGLYGLKYDKTAPGLLPTSQIWGVAISKQLFGPVGLGAWALSDATGGLSMSLTF